MEENASRKWRRRILDFINPLRDPSLTVAVVLTFIVEIGQHDAWYIVILVALVNWLAVRGVVWLVVNFAFAAAFLSRRLYWAIRHPRLAWRLLDAIGHEEIVIGGFASMSDQILLQDGTMLMSPALGASGIHIIGELPAGTELPMLGMPGQQMSTTGYPAPSFFTGTEILGGDGQSQLTFPQAGSNVVSAQNTDNLTNNFSQRSSEEEVRLRQQVEAYSRLMEDWIQFTEEKWRAINDSQLGWKPLRGRWGNWEDIFNDVYAAKTSDVMAQAAQSSGEATARRFETAKDKGSAASAVSCFMRDMVTLRRGLEMLRQPDPARHTTRPRPVIKSFSNPFSPTGTLVNGSSTSGQVQRNSLIRRPSSIFVDADTQK